MFMYDLHLLWSGFGPETKAALIGAASTISVGIIGFGGLILQMRSQGKQSRDAIAENERRRLKAAMYEDAVAVCRDLADQAIELANALRMMMLQVEYAAQAHQNGQPYDLPAARYPVLLEKFAQFSDAAIKFVFLVENRRVVDPRILIFRTAMSVVLHDTRKLMHAEFAVNVMTSIPAQLPDGRAFPYTPPSVQHAANIKQLCERFIDATDAAVMYTEDFMVELQNALLGDLFEKQVAHRKPLDPAKKVITLENADELDRWFAASTDWGREMARIEAETAARFLADQP
ncbi:MAG: hypothetical protein B7Y36_16915 [Novosphingobium sp. 28-62-57]|uniref:hypothetical protein n=1 Tax=unclassified Novosphingobium TaxID=2644732 RepID=UPI000BD63E25|nr:MULTISPECIES: hypothetical protein [unclassified Novosphingobium]OYW48569.1 MAG: hypothetical protein B7Z34_13485 [Novosphingobium sp. 12-62-10]OYZ08505.1 MAG: hypothetical protein B7Y36_16915 [Novosphingobium sp. 28-62-57]